MTLLTEQELMDRTTSMKDPNRQPRTHADEPTNTWLKSLSIVEKFKLNKEIREKNSERRKKTLEHKREPAKPAGSPTASYVTITDEEWQHVQSSKSLFDRVKEFASDKVLTVLEKSMSETEKGKDRASEAVEDGG
ncbi:hypothetical protein MPER_01498 [Moniliophthora perniciosa FA553]|nr:hypothetical protein MPER_01498 [Moniliophthora perniciosa FA553]